MFTHFRHCVMIDCLTTAMVCLYLVIPLLAFAVIFIFLFCFFFLFRNKCLRICQWPCKTDTVLSTPIPSKLSDDFSKPLQSFEKADYLTVVTNRSVLARVPMYAKIYMYNTSQCNFFLVCL